GSTPNLTAISATSSPTVQRGSAAPGRRQRRRAARTPGEQPTPFTRGQSQRLFRTFTPASLPWEAPCASCSAWAVLSRFFVARRLRARDTGIVGQSASLVALAGARLLLPEEMLCLSVPIAPT